MAHELSRAQAQRRKLVLNLICRGGRGANRPRALLPTARNILVKDHYTDLGFSSSWACPAMKCVYELKLAGYKPLETCVDVKGV